MGKVSRTSKGGNLSNCQGVQSRLGVKATQGPQKPVSLGTKPAVKLDDPSPVAYEMEKSLTTYPALYNAYDDLSDE